MRRLLKFLCLTLGVASLSSCGNVAVPGIGARTALSHTMPPRQFNPFNKNAAPNHVLTWAAINHADNVSPTSATPYLDWADVAVADASAWSAAGIKTVLYTDPNRVSPKERLYTHDESTFAHDCNGNRITINGRPGPKYQMDPHSGHLLRLWQSWVQWAQKIGGHYDAIFDDSADSVRNTSTLPCGFDQTNWTEASNLMNQGLGASIVYNGLGTLTDGFNNPPPAIKLNPTTIGGMLEGCYANPTIQNPVPKMDVFVNYETTELTMNIAKKPFVCRGMSTFPGKTSLAIRIYMYASFLLTYDPASSIISEKFSTPSNLGVFPEETLVALNPVMPAPGTVDQLKTARWTYGRQYASCYLWGQPIGGCAAVVNADVAKHPHPFPWAGVYGHTLVLSGAGILDGGRASVTGPAPPATIPGTTAIIAIQ